MGEAQAKPDQVPLGTRVPGAGSCGSDGSRETGSEGVVLSARVGRRVWPEAETFVSQEDWKTVFQLEDVSRGLLLLQTRGE